MPISNANDAQHDFHKGPRAFQAPARVNLIGEHTDYSGGFVLPMAIPFTTTALLAPATDGGYLFQSETFPSERRLSPEDRSEGVRDWSDYPVGVLRELQALGIEPPPFTLKLSGNIPLGSGLSSSASIEVVTAVALLAHSGQTLRPEDIALLCQRAENDYVHSPCGIMDQFVVTLAKAGHALLINTRDLTYESLPMNTGEIADARIIIINSMVKHSVATGEYRVRRREVEEGQAAVRAAFPAVRDLGEATLEQLAAAAGNMSVEAMKRSRHIISENARVLKAKAAMLAGDAQALGQQMTQAHASYRDDFAASVPEVDFLVDTALAQKGCYGARLTGGGFGGCTVNLVAAENAKDFIQTLQSDYQQRFGIHAEAYICEAADGAIARLNADQGHGNA